MPAYTQPLHTSPKILESGFTINDLRYWVWAFDQFIGDVRDLLPNPHDLPDQLSLEHLARKLEYEFNEDADYQRYWWLYIDRAAEAIPLLESDGPEHTDYPVEGFDSHMSYDKIREYQTEEAYINLVGSNVDRKMGDLKNFNPNFYAEPIHPEHKEMIRALNHWVKNIKDNNDFPDHWRKYKFEMITIGSGVMRFSHGVNWDSSDFAMFKNYIQRRDFLTVDELERFEDVFNYHNIQYIPSFNVVRFRGAAGAQASSFSHPSHRQVHWFEHIPLAEARNRYPEFADKLTPSINDKALEVSPSLSLARDRLQDMVTLIHHQVRFPVRETLEIPVVGPDSIEYHYKDQPRRAVGHITQAPGVGIIDMDLDPYDHGRFDLVQGVNFPSSKHSAGIGMIKFGRDPAIVHNKLHNGALSYFRRQIKGGGYYLDQVIDEDDLAEQAKGNRWVKVDFSKIKQYVSREKGFRLSDFIMDNRPPTFPSAWAGLMQLEEQALDRAMRSGSAWRGERTGYSGLQQQIASQDSAMMHANTHEILRSNVQEMSKLTFDNVVQFDGDRPIEFSRENEFGDIERFELNQPMMPVPRWIGHKYKMVASYIKNHIGTMRFITRIEPESIVPNRPGERVNFFIQMLQFLFPYLQTAEGRIMLKGFQSEGMRIPSLSASIDQIEELDKERMNLNAQLSEITQEYEKLQDDREWAKDKAEINQNLLRLTQKFVSDLARANPETVNKIMSGKHPEIKNEFITAVRSLLAGTGAGGGGQTPTIPPTPDLGQDQQLQQFLNQNQPE